MTGISNTCCDCVTSSLVWPGKKQHKTKRRERSFPKNHNKSHSRCPQLTPYLGSGWYWGYSHRPGVSLSVARPDSPAQSNISRVPSPETGPEWENERLVKWGMPGAGWAGDTRKGEEPGAFYNPGTDSFPFWLLHNQQNAIWKGLNWKIGLSFQSLKFKVLYLLPQLKNNGVGRQETLRYLLLNLV